MNIKFSCIFIVSLFFIQGCSSLNKANPEDPSIKDSDFMTDIDAQANGKQVELAPILDSTHEILMSEQSADQVYPDQQLLNQNVKTEYDNVWNRLPELYQFSNIDNKRIEQQKKWFLKHKKHIEDISERAIPFLHFITEEVNKRNMPGEIALLPIIESGFKTKATSRMKAAGLWQFMPATGRHFGLKQNWWYDGRRDVYHSTLAALTYLQQLNKYYKGDWLLALAAYNAGSGNVNRAIRRNLKKGKPIDYWSLSLPKETTKYVPKLIAMSQIIKEHQKYAVELTPIGNLPHLILVNTKSQINLSLVAKMTEMNLNELQTYNPAFKQWATDPDGPHHLFIPIDKVERYETQFALLDDKDRVKSYRHKIRSGESLSLIARRYNISVPVLKKLNHLKNNRIRAGKYLMVPSGDNALLAQSNKPKAKSKTTKQISQNIADNAQIYRVRRGDSFWKIARRFNMSHKKLASLNGMSSGSILSIGQKLFISKNNSTALQTSKLKQDLNNNVISYQVKSGDSLYTISKQFKVTINDLKRWNQLNLKKYLKPGQKLTVILMPNSQAI